MGGWSRKAFYTLLQDDQDDTMGRAPEKSSELLKTHPIISVDDLRVPG